MAINEEVYAALISGHAFTGNMDAAKQLIQMMKQGELPPGLTSYSALLSGQLSHNINKYWLHVKYTCTYVPPWPLQC